MPVDYSKVLSRRPTLAQNLSPDMKAKIGGGLRLPLLMENSGMWWTRSGQGKVKQSIYTILTTPVGRRLGQPDFGSELPYLIFQGINAALLNSDLVQATQNALKAWEPRILVNQVICTQDPTGLNQVRIAINYTYKGTQAQDNFTLVVSQSDELQFTSADFQINGSSFLGT